MVKLSAPCITTAKGNAVYLLLALLLTVGQARIIEAMEKWKTRSAKNCAVGIVGILTFKLRINWPKLHHYEQIYDSFLKIRPNTNCPV